MVSWTLIMSGGIKLLSAIAIFVATNGLDGETAKWTAIGGGILSLIAISFDGIFIKKINDVKYEASRVLANKDIKVEEVV